MRAALTLVLGVSFGAVPGGAMADPLFGESALSAAVQVISEGQCTQLCTIADWRVQAIGSPPGLPESLAERYRFYLATSVHALCGSQGCAEAYLAFDGQDLQVIDAEHGLSALRPLDASGVAAWAAGPQRQDAAPPTLRAGFDMGPFLAELSRIDFVDETIREAAVQAAGLAVELAVHAESPRLFLDAFRLNGSVLAGLVLQDPVRAAQLAAERVAEGIATDLAVSVMADLVTDALFSRAPLDALNAPWQPVLRSALRSAIYEFGLLFADGPTPAAAVSGIFRRVNDIWEIYLAARGLADDRDAALIALANSLETAVVLTTSYPSERNAALASDSLRIARQSVPDIVGRADAPAVEELVTLGFMALMAIHTDRRDRAEMLLARMYEHARIGSTNRPLYARLDPRQWLPAVASMDVRPPAERAVHALIAATRLRELTEAPPLQPVPGITQGALAIARDLNEAYGSDRARLRLVAEHADHALLALAAYGDEAVLEAAARRGWVPVPGHELVSVDAGLLVGPVVARLFQGRDGQVVLAFRGTSPLRDWTTNLPGTAGIPFTTGQIRVATQLAVRLRADHPGITFVGHSLGGRLAQVARLATGRPAVIFNSAPLGVADPLFVLAADAEAMIRTLMARGDARVPLHRFRSPADLLTQSFPPGDTEVSNVVTTEALTGWAARIPGINLVGWIVHTGVTQYLHDHGMGALAPAMEIVRIAHEQGWMEAYYASIEPVPEEPAAPPQWFERLVPGGRLTGYGFGQFPSLGNRTHAGVNIGGGCGLPVLAAADGEVAGVLAFGDGRLDSLGHAILLRHAPEGGRPVNTLYLHLQARPALSVGQAVAAGQEIGRTGATGTTGFPGECLLHFEVRHFDDWLHPDWGNILGPGDWRETAEFRTGWSDPEGWLDPAPDPVPDRNRHWGPDVVANIPFDQSYRPCAAHSSDRSCLQRLGLSDAAIEFVYLIGGDYAGDAWAEEFVELGEVDLIRAFWVGADVHRFDALANGELGLHVLEPSRNLRQEFRDSISQAILRRHPDAGSFYTRVVSHRVLPDGTQRFVEVMDVSSSCRVCPSDGSAIRFQEVGPGTNRLIVTTPVGIIEARHAHQDNLSPALLISHPIVLQHELNLLGYHAGPMDGIFGRASQAALSEFQRDYCLPETGRIDRATAAALVDADRFAPAPCVGRSPVGAGLLPIAPGTFAFDHRQCTEDEAAWEELLADFGAEAFLMVYQFGEDEIRFGASECRVQRSTLTGGTLSVSAQCLEEGMGPFPRVLSFNHVGRNSFAMSHPSGEDFTFFRCDYPVAETQVAGLRPGNYVSNPALCSNIYEHYLHLRMIHRSYVVFGWETGCMIDRHQPAADGTQYFGLCREGVQAFAGEWRWRVEGPEQFVEVQSLFEEGDGFRNGLRFTRCPGD